MSCRPHLLALAVSVRPRISCFQPKVFLSRSYIINKEYEKVVNVSSCQSYLPPHVNDIIAIEEFVQYWNGCEEIL